MRLVQFEDAPLPTRMASSQLGIGSAPSGYEKGISLSPVDVGAGGILRNQTVQYTHDGSYVPVPYPLVNLLDDAVSDLTNTAYWTLGNADVSEIVSDIDFAYRGRNYAHLRYDSGIAILNLGATSKLAVAPNTRLHIRFFYRGHGTLRFRINEQDGSNTLVRRTERNLLLAADSWRAYDDALTLQATTQHVAFQFAQRGQPYGDIYLDAFAFYVAGRHPENLIFNGDFSADVGWTASGDGAWTRRAVEGAWRYAHAGASGNFSLASTTVRSLLPRLRDDRYWFSLRIAGDDTDLVCLRGTWRDQGGAALGTVIAHCTDAQLDGPQEFGLFVDRPTGAVWLDAEVVRTSDGASDFYVSAIVLNVVDDALWTPKSQYDRVNALYGTRGRLWARMDSGQERWIYARLNSCQNRQSMQSVGAGTIDASFSFESEGLLWHSDRPKVYAGDVGDAIVIVNDGEDTWNAVLELDLASDDDMGNTAGVTVSLGDVHLVFSALQIDAGNRLVIDGYAETVKQTIANVETPAFNKLQLAPAHVAPRLLIIPRGISTLTTAGTHLSAASAVKLTFYEGRLL